MLHEPAKRGGRRPTATAAALVINNRGVTSGEDNHASMIAGCFTQPPWPGVVTSMPNVAIVLREEIQRLARKQVKAGLSPVRREHLRLRKSVADLRRQVAALTRTNQELQSKLTGLAASQGAEAPKEPSAGLRPTSRSLGALRRRLGLSQVQFGRLLGVSGQAVGQWETKSGKVRMRSATLIALAGIQFIGKREALRRLETMAEVMPETSKSRARRSLKR